MKKRFTDEQMIGVLKEAGAEMKVADLRRKYGISDVTFYNWKATGTFWCGRIDRYFLG